MSNLTDRIVAIAEELDALAGDLDVQQKRNEHLYQLAESMLHELEQALGKKHVLIEVYQKRLKHLR